MAGVSARRGCASAVSASGLILVAALLAAARAATPNQFWTPTFADDNGGQEDAPIGKGPSGPGVDVPKAVDALQKYEDLVVDAQERDDARIIRSASDLLRFEAQLSGGSSNASSAVSKLVVLRTDAVAHGKPSPELRAAIVAEHEAEARVKRQYEACRRAAADIESKLSMHSSQVAALNRTRKAIDRPARMHGTHVTEFNDRVLLIQQEASIDGHDGSAKASSDEKTEDAATPGVEDRSVIGKLVARMLESSSVATSKLEKQREAVLQPCQQRLEEAQAAQREAREAREKLEPTRVNVTGVVEGIDEAIEVLRKTKTQGDLIVEVLRKYREGAETAHQKRTEGRDPEETAVETLGLHYDAVLDVRKRENLAKQRSEREAATARHMQLVTEMVEKEQQCDAEIDELEKGLDRAERMAEVLEEIVVLVMSSNQRDDVAPASSVGGKTALPAVLAALEAGSGAEAGGDAEEERDLLMSLLQNNNKAGNAPTTALLQQDEPAEGSPMAAAVAKLRSFTDKRIDEARSKLREKSAACERSIGDLFWQLVESAARIMSMGGSFDMMGGSFFGPFSK